ncbi:conserved hypothetical protein [Burkholderia vietnamiensis]|nr:conserved hypothetical protein [Burkholderia vietnamiensis]
MRDTSRTRLTYCIPKTRQAPPQRKPVDEKRESIPVLPFAVNHLCLRPRNAASHLTIHRPNRPCRIPFTARRG